MSKPLSRSTKTSFVLAALLALNWQAADPLSQKLRNSTTME